MIRLLAFCMMVSPAMADTVLAARTVRPTEILTAADLLVRAGDTPGAHSQPHDVIGQEARVALYAGRPIRVGDTRPAALIERNALVELIFRKHGLQITAEGRSLDRAAVGEQVFVLNAASRMRVSGRVLPDGRVLVE